MSEAYEKLKAALGRSNKIAIDHGLWGHASQAEDALDALEELRAVSDSAMGRKEGDDKLPQTLRDFQTEGERSDAPVEQKQDAAGASEPEMQYRCIWNEFFAVGWCPCSGEVGNLATALREKELKYRCPSRFRNVTIEVRRKSTQAWEHPWDGHSNERELEAKLARTREERDVAIGAARRAMDDWEVRGSVIDTLRGTVEALQEKAVALTAERDEARRTRDLAQAEATRNVEAKRVAEAELGKEQAERIRWLADRCYLFSGIV